MKTYGREWRYSSTDSYARMEVTGQHNAPATSPPGKKHQHSLNRRRGELQGRSRRLGDEKNRWSLPGFESWIAQPVALSLYRYAVPAPLFPENNLFSNVYFLFFKTLSLRHSSPAIIPSYYQSISCNISFHCLVGVSISVLVTTMATQNRCNLLQLRKEWNARLLIRWMSHNPHTKLSWHVRSVPSRSITRVWGPKGQPQTATFV